MIQKSKNPDGLFQHKNIIVAQTIGKAVAREVAKAHAHYQAILNEKGTTTLQTSLKISSGSHGFKVMDPFDWTKDKSIYQRWQIWSGKARLTLDAMEGDSEKTKISYFHHWINGEGMRQIESWKNSKTLISQSTYGELENKDKEGKYHNILVALKGLDVFQGIRTNFTSSQTTSLHDMHQGKFQFTLKQHLRRNRVSSKTRDTRRGKRAY